MLRGFSQLPIDRRKKEEGRRKKEEGRRKKEEGGHGNAVSLPHNNRELDE
jgi:hypothetical protein